MAKYYEVVLEAPHLMTVGFVYGYLHGSGLSGLCEFSEENKIKLASVKEKVFELIKKHEFHSHMILEDTIFEPLMKAFCNLKKNDKAHIEVKEAREILSAYFEFNFEAFTKKHGDEIDAIFAAAGNDVTIDWGEKRQQTDPDGKGVELYTQLHDYEYKAKGTVKGPIGPILKLHKIADMHKLIEVEEIHLEIGQKIDIGCYKSSSGKD